MPSAGTLWINIAARTDKLTKGLDSVRARLKRFGTIVGVAGIGAVTTGVAAATAAFREMAPRIDDAAKAADRLALSTESLSALGHAAGLSGASVDTLTKGLTYMVRNVGEASTGTGEAADALESLGLNAVELSKLNADQMFLQISQAISQLPTAAQRTSAAMDIFGRSGANLLPLMNEGAGGIRALMEDAKRLGVTFTRQQAGMVEAANDAMERVTAAFDGLKTQLTIALSPAITEVAERFASFVASLNDGGGASSKFSAGMESLGRTLGVLADVIESLKILWKGLSLLTAKTLDFLATNVEQLGLKVFKLINKLQGGGKLRELKAESIIAVSNAQRKADIANQAKELDALLVAPSASEKIDRFFEDIKRKADEAAKAVGESVQNAVLPPRAEEFFQKLGSSIAGAAGIVTKAAGAGFSAAASLGRGGGDGLPPALALTRAGTAESYRQRIAISRQDETAKIAKQHFGEAKKQTNILEQIKVGLGGVVPSNIFG